MAEREFWIRDQGRSSSADTGAHTLAAMLLSDEGNLLAEPEESPGFIDALLALPRRRDAIRVPGVTPPG